MHPAHSRASTRLSSLDIYHHNQLLFPSPVFSRRKAISDLKRFKGPVRAWRAAGHPGSQTHLKTILSEYLDTVSGHYSWDGDGLCIPRSDNRKTQCLLEPGVCPLSQRGKHDLIPLSSQPRPPRTAYHEALSATRIPAASQSCPELASSALD